MTLQPSRMPSRRWWAAVAVALSVLIVARTNTVDAPADAMVVDLADPGASVEAGHAAAGFTLPSPGAPSDGDSSRYLWTLESEIRALDSGDSAMSISVTVQPSSSSGTISASGRSSVAGGGGTKAK